MKNLKLFIAIVLITTSIFSQNSLQLGRYVSFESSNFPGRFIRHQNFNGKITKINSQLDKKDATFKIVKSLDGRDGFVSFESINYPGYYLRHSNFILKLNKNNGTLLFKSDASFKEVQGLAGTGVSFESSNFPGRFIRHQNFILKLHTRQNYNLFKKDASFNIKYDNFSD